MEQPLLTESTQLGSFEVLIERSTRRIKLLRVIYSLILSTAIFLLLGTFIIIPLFHTILRDFKYIPAYFVDNIGIFGQLLHSLIIILFISPLLYIPRLGLENAGYISIILKTRPYLKATNYLVALFSVISSLLFTLNDYTDKLSTYKSIISSTIGCSFTGIASILFLVHLAVIIRCFNQNPLPDYMDYTTGSSDIATAYPTEQYTKGKEREWRLINAIRRENERVIRKLYI